MTLDYEIYKEGGLLKDRYQKLEDISEGSYGYVSLAKDTVLKKLVAVKYIFKTEESYEKDNDNDATKGSNNSSVEKQKMLLKRQRSLISERVRSRLSRTICFEALYEVDIQSKIGKHKNITELFDYFDSYIIMEYCSGGDLYEAIKADIIPRKTKQLSHIISQIMDAVEYVHSKGIYHRDIKPENILIADSNWTIKLTDWGLATTERTSMDRNVGSERYMAPELFESNLDYDERNEPYDCSKVDIWAIGIVLLNIVFHKNPFSVANQTDKSFCYFAANREALFDVFSTMSYDFFQLLRHSLTIDPTNRYLSSMREELSRLGEYTLDDECYNSLSEDGEEMVSEGDESYARPTRFQEVDSTHTNNTPYSETDSPPLPLTMPVSVPTANTGHITPAPSKNEGKDPIPKFTFTKRSHPKPSTYSEKNTKPIRIKNNRKIIKNTRKPLGIPTPNSHINNYFHEYNSNNDSGDFNTKDFYTPPSVHNKYMEGVFSKRNKHRRNSHQYYSNDHNNGRPSSANAAARPFQNAGSYGNNNNNNGNITSMNNNGRRGSSISAQSSQPNGKYVPPHSRNSTSNSSPNNIIPPHDGNSPKGGSTYHEQHRLALDAEPEVDDVLFTLEESDVDNNFISDMSNLTVHEQSSYNRGRLSISMDNYGGMNGNHLNTGNGNHTYVPDLLKSPQSPTDLHNHLKNFNFNMNSNARRQSASEYKPKPGVYIPPHHRKSINQYSYNTLSSSVYGVGPTLSINSENYGSGAGTRKGSATRRTSTAGTMFNSINNHNNNLNKFDSQSTKFHKPYMPYNHAVSTTAIQNADVFAHTNSVVFEDDVDAPPTKRKSIHVQSLPKIKSGRKSSIQDDLVGSLEQYKNNWLILQQHQE